MIKFENKIESVIHHYHQRMEDELILFNNLTEEERIDRKDAFLLPVGMETGVFLNLLIKSAKSKVILEIGTAYGYSTIWLAEAAKTNGGKVISLEINQEKVDYAKNKIEEAGLLDYVEFRVGDALTLIEIASETFDFVLLDIWKELYTPCFELFFQKLNNNAWVIADNIINPPHHRKETESYLNAMNNSNAFNSILMPIGSGIEVSQKKLSI